jgi:hypothetical protein
MTLKCKKISLWLSVMAQAYNPSYLGGAEIMRIMASPGKNVWKNPSQPMAGCSGVYL